MDSFLLRQADRGLALVSGRESQAFLQGLVTADVAALDNETLLYSCLLTPQGKFLDDFFLFRLARGFALDAPKSRLPAIAQRFSMYKLKADVQLTLVKPQPALWVSSDKLKSGAASPALNARMFRDPRHYNLGFRNYCFQSVDLEEQGTAEDYQALRVRLGVPDAEQDLKRESSTLFDNGFDRIGAIAWEKGCYMGQEITARMKYRGLKKWDLLPLKLPNEPAESSTFVGNSLSQGDKTVGQITSVGGQFALARVRLDALEGATSGNLPPITLASHPVDWVALDYMRKSE